MLNNLNIKYFPFFNSLKTPVSQTGTSDPCYCNGFDTLILEVSGATTINAKIVGCVNQLDGDSIILDDDDCVYSDLAIFKASDLSKVDSISANGIYYVGINGCSRVKVQLTAISGSAQIIGALEK